MGFHVSLGECRNSGSSTPWTFELAAEKDLEGGLLGVD